MMCYKDKTYCIRKCANYSCDRMLTPYIRNMAKKHGLGISMAEFSNCKEFKEPTR